MLFKTHIAFGFLVGLAALKIFNPLNTRLFFVLVLIGSVLPDIDHPKSKVGKKIKPIGFLFEHRGFFHSFVFLALIHALLFVFFRGNIFVMPLVIGYTSHLFIDCFNHRGIMPLHPFSKFRIKGLIKTGAWLETVLFLSFVVFSVWGLLSF